MKLNLVPPRTGIAWARSGVRLVLRQPVALIGLFLMFIVGLSVVSVVPWIGTALALVLVPAATAGLMSATREAEAGRFPMPLQLVTAFRQGPACTRAMLLLGMLYALGVLALLGLSALLDGGRLAQLYLGGGSLTQEAVQDPAFHSALWLSALLYLPLSLLFWHAPALVLWHGVTPVKSLFFSLVAVLRNAGAFVLYTLAWMALSFVAAVALVLLTGLTGQTAIVNTGMLPVVLLLGTMFFASMWGTFRDCFAHGDADAAANELQG